MSCVSEIIPLHTPMRMSAHSKLRFYLNDMVARIVTVQTFKDKSFPAFQTMITKMSQQPLSWRCILDCLDERFPAVCGTWPARVHAHIYIQRAALLPERHAPRVGAKAKFCCACNDAVAHRSRQHARCTAGQTQRQDSPRARVCCRAQSHPGTAN